MAYYESEFDLETGFFSVRNYFLTQEITASPCALKDPNSYIFCPC
jgi:hypothetical protein